VPFDLNFIYIIIMVFFLEGILSIDNAAVLGAMVSVLPEKDRVPWPKPLGFLSHPVHRLLGGQRSAALKVGLLGAYAGRGLMLILASFVIHNEWLKLIGALYLIKLAFENLGAPESGEEEQIAHDRVSGKGFWGIVVAVELADLAFSLDNVVAVVALSTNLWIVMFGVAMGILTMRFAAGIFTWMIVREPILKPAAYMVVFNIGAELLLNEFFQVEFPSWAKFVISIATLLLFVVFAHVRVLQFLTPVLRWVAEGMADVNELIDWALVPVIRLFQITFKIVWFLFCGFAAFLIPSRMGGSSGTAGTEPSDNPVATEYDIKRSDNSRE
jgi:tellurite resistance protein TerC